MAGAIHIAISTSNSSSTANTTQYWTHIGAVAPTTTEANAQIPIYVAGNYAQFSVKLNLNSVNGITVYNFRVSANNSGPTISVASSTSGTFQDTTNYAVVASGNLCSIQTVPASGSTGTFNPEYFATTFFATTDTVSKLSYSNAGTIALNSVSANFYAPLSGFMNTTANSIATTENIAQCNIEATGTLANLAINITANARTSSQTFRLRKNTANANQTISISGSQTGLLRDSTHTDSVVAGDLVDYNFATSADATSVSTTISQMSIEYTNTSGVGMLAAGTLGTAGTAIAKTTTNYYPIACRVTNTATESGAQFKLQDSFTFHHLSATITANGIAAASTLTLRNNSASTAVVASITASTTGRFVDSTHSVACVSGDLVAVQLITGTSGGTVTLTMTAFTLFADGPTETARTRLYLHNAASAVSGTLPTTSQSGRTIDASFTNVNTNQSMNTTKGTSQATLSLTRTNTASAFEQYYGAKFVSDPINQTSITAKTWTVNYAISCNPLPNTAFPVSDFNTNGYAVFSLYVWRPSTGAKVGNIYLPSSSNEIFVTNRVSGSGTDERTAIDNVTVIGSAVTCQVGDVIICEIWSGVRGTVAASRSLGIYIDGTVITNANNVSVTDHASYIEVPQTIAFSAPASSIDMTPNLITLTNKFITKI